MQVYHGPREGVLDFFESLNFRLPPPQGRGRLPAGVHVASRSEGASSAVPP